MDILNLDKTLRTTEPVVQVQADLGAGVYLVELMMLDAAGVQSSAQVTFEIQGRIVRPPIDVTPVVRPVVVSPVTPVVTPVTPVTPVVPTPRAPAKRVVVKKPKPSDPTE